MAVTIGKAQTTAAGRLRVGASGKAVVNGATDSACCCAPAGPCTSCEDAGGPTTAEVTVAGAGVCFSGCDGLNGGISGTTFSGTWTLPRVYPSTLYSCQYEGTFAYTAVQANLYEAGGDCATLVCSTTHVFIRLTWDGLQWLLQAYLIRPDGGSGCTCADTTTPGVGDVSIFQSDLFSMDPCGDSANGSQLEDCQTTISEGTCSDGIGAAAGQVSHGGTWTVTI